MTIYGTTPAFLSVRDWDDLAEGDAFTDRDVKTRASVCLIGATLKRELFPNDSPLGKEIRIGNAPFRVVGVLGKKGANSFGMDQDDIVLAPWTTIKLRLRDGGPWSAASTTAAPALASGPSEAPPNNSAAPSPKASAPTAVDQILAKAASPAEIATATTQITELLRRRHRIQTNATDDFNIRDMSETVRAFQSMPKMPAPSR